MVDDHRSARVTVSFFDFNEPFDDNRIDSLLVRQNRAQIGDQYLGDSMFLGDFVPLESRQTLQSHFQDRMGLGFREAKSAHQAFACLFGIPGLTDEFNDSVKIVQGNLEARQDVQPFLGFTEIVGCAACDGLATVIDESKEYFLEIE